MADLQKYGRTEQLLDKDNIVDGGNYYPTSTEMAKSNNTKILLIPCKPLTTYTASRTNVITKRFTMCFLTSADIYEGMPIYGNAGSSTSLTATSTSAADSQYLCLYYAKSGGSDSSTSEEIQNQLAEVMVNEGSTALPYEPYLDWQHSLRKLTTATEAVENPLYSDGTTITAYTIKGNTVQNGTPTPSNPVEVNGVGVRTENLANENDLDLQKWISSSGTISDNPNGTIFKEKIVITTTNYTVKATANQSDVADIGAAIYNSNDEFIRREYSASLDKTLTFATTTGDNYFKVIVSTRDTPTESLIKSLSVMANEGSTAKPYEPYGYKIPISSGGVTTNIYLGSTQTVRQIKKLMLDGTEDWVRQSVNNYGIANFQLAMPDRLTGTDTIGFISHFEHQTTSISVTQSMGYYIGGGAGKLLYLRCDSTIGTDKSDFTAWLAAQYSAGTPVTVWYVLATPETAIVNEPLMKIGDYADTLSNATAIPTTEGANSITVDTTVQPSEFTATWTGWHDAEVKEYDGSDWQ